MCQCEGCSCGQQVSPVEQIVEAAEKIEKSRPFCQCSIKRNFHREMIRIIPVSAYKTGPANQARFCFKKNPFLSGRRPDLNTSSTAEPDRHLFALHYYRHLTRSAGNLQHFF